MAGQKTVVVNATPFHCFDQMHTDTAILGMIVLARSAIFQCAIQIKLGMAAEMAEAMRLAENPPTIDTRNAQDGIARGNAEGASVREDQGHGVEMHPYQKAELLAKIHAFCYNELASCGLDPRMMPTTIAGELDFFESGRVAPPKPDQERLIKLLEAGGQKVDPARLALRKVAMARNQADTWKALRKEVLIRYDAYLRAPSKHDDQGASGMSSEDLGAHCFALLPPKEGMPLWNKIIDGIDQLINRTAEDITLGLGLASVYTIGDVVCWRDAWTKEQPIFVAARNAYHQRYQEILTTSNDVAPRMDWAERPAVLAENQVMRALTEEDINAEL